MLGIHKAANLNETAEFNYLKEKATDYINAMNARPLPQHEAWLCYLIIFLPSITYSLCTTSLSQKQCKMLQTIVTPRILPRMRFQRNVPKTVVYRSRYAGGLGYMNYQ
eukprot:5737177-Ditylum_brightwellii.AAC.2